MEWATFWAIFSQTHLVFLGSTSRHVSLNAVRQNVVVFESYKILKGVEMSSLPAEPFSRLNLLHGRETFFLD
jgi:hypothetical protein